MMNILVLLFCITLISLLTSGRLRTYSNALALQGVLLCAISFKELQELKELNYLNLVFIMLETLLFKGIIVPFFLNYLIKKIISTMKETPTKQIFIHYSKLL